MAKNLKVGKRVSYLGNDGFERAAVVLGTHESTKPGTNVTQPEPGNANLLVYKPGSGETYVRTNVKQGTGAGTFQL